MIWVMTAIFMFAGQPPVKQEFQFRDRQDCETKRIEILSTVQIAQVTPCTARPLRRRGR